LTVKICTCTMLPPSAPIRYQAVISLSSVAERLTEGFYGASAPDGTGTMLS
jgi:hypothetical protein